MGLIDKAQLTEPDFARFVLDCFVDFHSEPIDAGRLSASLGHFAGQQALRHGLRGMNIQDCHLIGDHISMQDVKKRICKFGPTDHTVLIQGESGTGKEVVAKELHRQSSRAGGPWVAVNCAALPENLIQAELFGCEKGAYTSASASREGKFEAAQGGTIFLDEIGEMSLEAQASLLRALEDLSVTRLGCNRSRPLNVRVLAATNANLMDAVKRGRFRQDLFFRISALQINMPPLRERGADILLLADVFLRQLANNKKVKPKRLAVQARWLLVNQKWAGNVRELKNVIIQGFVMSESDIITPDDMGLSLDGGPMPSLEKARCQAENHYLERLLTLTDNNHTQAAIQAGISRTQLYRLLRKHSII